MKHSVLPTSARLTWRATQPPYDLVETLRIVRAFSSAEMNRTALRDAMGALVQLTGARTATVQMNNDGIDLEVARPFQRTHSKPAQPGQSASVVDAVHRLRLSDATDAQITDAQMPTRLGGETLRHVLSDVEGAQEVLTLVFDGPVDMSKGSELSTLLDTLRAVRVRTANSIRTPQADGMQPILNEENRFNLTPAERRVCHLLGQGLKPVSMTMELDLGITTVRSHLAKIYAKTGLNSQVKIVHALHACAASEGVGM